MAKELYDLASVCFSHPIPQHHLVPPFAKYAGLQLNPFAQPQTYKLFFIFIFLSLSIADVTDSTSWNTFQIPSLCFFSITTSCLHATVISYLGH